MDIRTLRFDRSYFSMDRITSPRFRTTSRTSHSTNSSMKKSRQSLTSLKSITRQRNLFKLVAFCIDKRLSELEISPEDFLPSGKLADVYIPNYAYLPINGIEALNITSDRPNGDTISNEDRFYVWARLKSARRKAIELTHWDQKVLLPFTRISPYGLWTALTKSTSSDNTYVIDYYQHIAAELSAEKKNLSSTLHFYDMFIRPLECFFACNTPFGDMLLQSRDHLNKSTKIVQIALRLTNRSYAPPNLDYAFIYEELTKIRHLTYSNLRTHFQEDLSPPSRLHHLIGRCRPPMKNPTVQHLKQHHDSNRKPAKF
jgi:hypothetical protein